MYYEEQRAMNNQKTPKKVGGLALSSFWSHYKVTVIKMQGKQTDQWGRLESPEIV